MRISEAEVQEDHQARHVKKWRTHSGRGLRLSGQWFDDQADVVDSMLERLAHEAGPDAETGMFEPYGARLADALYALASQKLRSDTARDRPTVILTVDLERLQGDNGRAHLASGPPVSTATALRLPGRQRH